MRVVLPHYHNAAYEPLVAEGRSLFVVLREFARIYGAQRRKGYDGSRK